MILNKSDLKCFLSTESTFYKSGGVRKLIWIWQSSMRHFEYFYNTPSFIHNIFAHFYKIKMHFFGIILGFECNAPNIFDVGLKIYHSGSLLVNSTTRVGKNCTIIGSCCLGGKNGGGGPTIGDNCILGINCCVIGEVKLGNEVSVGAGAVVTKSFGNKSKVVGVPAKEI